MTQRLFRGSLFLAVFLGALSQGSRAVGQPQIPGGPGRGPGGPGGGQELQILDRFDRDKSGRLESAERQAAREFVESQATGRVGLGRRGRGFATTGPIQPGPRLDRASARTFPASVPFYDFKAIRTLFFEFENAEWEKELMAFKETDVEVPATLTVDGKTYRDVGTQFRGASSFMMVPEGLKHSLNVSLDAWKEQNLLGFRSLNLLNGNGDPSHLRAMLYLMVARAYGPAARANLVRVVINGESWGIFGNVEQVNKEFVETWFKTDKGARWKVPGSPGGRGGLEYVGDDVARYRGTFELKSKEDPKAWDALVRLTKVLNQTPVAELEAALKPVLDLDGALRFLAIDNTLVNTDGYWTRASDYNLYLDPKGVFHLIPHDANETFGPSGGGRGRGGFGGPPPTGGDAPRGGGPGAPVFGGRGGRGGMVAGGPTLDLLVGLDDDTKPLRSRLLAVPSLREKYLAYCKEIATKWLDWKTLEPVATQAHELIQADVKADTRKLTTNEAFDASLQQLKAFVDERRAYVLNYGRP